MKQGISIDEACAMNAIGTKEDFERSCNPDGTVKERAETTTISIKNTDESVTVPTAYLQIGLGLIIVLTVLAVVLIVRKFKYKAK